MLTKRRFLLLAGAFLLLHAQAQVIISDTIAISDAEAAAIQAERNSTYPPYNFKKENAERMSQASQVTGHNKVWKRRKYLNMAFALSSMKLTALTQLQWKSDYAVALTSGRTFYLHKRPILGRIKIGLDWTNSELSYAKYSEHFDGNYHLENHAATNTNIEQVRSDLECRQLEYGMHLGPSVTINPTEQLKLNAYFRYAPTLSILFMNHEVSSSYGSYFVSGGSIAYKIISLGVEARWGEVKYKKMAVDNDFEFDHIGEMSSYNCLIGNSNHKVKTSSVRFYLSFRF